MTMTDRWADKLKNSCCAKDPEGRKSSTFWKRHCRAKIALGSRHLTQNECSWCHFVGKWVFYQKKKIRFIDNVLEINYQSCCILSGPPCTRTSAINWQPVDTSRRISADSNFLGNSEALVASGCHRSPLGCDRSLPLCDWGFKCVKIRLHGEQCYTVCPNKKETRFISKISSMPRKF